MTTGSWQEQTRRVVVKIGTGVLTEGVGRIDRARLAAIAAQIAELRAGGREVVVVSSGAIGLGMGRLGLARRPTRLARLQACAAIGQTVLMELWEQALAVHKLPVAQLLLTREDVRARQRHLNLRQTVDELLALGYVPIVNENDSVSVDEIKFGDNDILSALVAVLTKSPLLVILSTIPGLLKDQGRGELVPLVEAITPEVEALAGGTTSVTAVGGMKTKLGAAQVATQSGCAVFLGSGRDDRLLPDLLAGQPRGTLFLPRRAALGARKRWLAWFEKAEGRVWIDAGAVKALAVDGRSLLAAGVTAVEGGFAAEATVDVVGPDGRPVARGRVHFSASELREMAGQPTATIRTRHPERRPEVMHRDELVVLA